MSKPQNGLSRPAGRLKLVVTTASAVVVASASIALATTSQSASSSGIGAAPSVKEPVPTLTAATFADPPTVVKPKYRWWMPVADESDAELRSELDQIAKTDGGGAEVTAFAAPNAAGTSVHNSEQYLAQYGYGTPEWTHRVEVMESEAKKDGLILDLAAGPRWPPTAPTISNFNQPQVAQQLIYGKELNAAGSTRTGALPVTTTSPPTVTTALCGPATAGATSLVLNSTLNLAVGDQVAVGAAPNQDTVTITKLGTSSPCTALASAAQAGATSVAITASATNLIPGDVVTVGSGADQEQATIKTSGTAAVHTTASAAVAAGATSLSVAGATGITAGDAITIDSGANVESATVSAVSGTTVTVSAPLGSAHAAGAAVSDPGSGITFTKPLTNAHPAGEQIIMRGTGISVTPVPNAHGVGDAVVDTARKKLVSVEVAECATACAASSTTPVSLDRSSVVDVTAKVDKQGDLNYTFPAGNGNPWVVLDFYQTADGQAEANVSPTGSDYVLDHLAAAGAEAIGDFWDQHVLNDPVVKQAIEQTAKTLAGHDRGAGLVRARRDDLEVLVRVVPVELQALALGEADVAVGLRGVDRVAVGLHPGGHVVALGPALQRGHVAVVVEVVVGLLVVVEHAGALAVAVGESGRRGRARAAAVTEADEHRQRLVHVVAAQLVELGGEVRGPGQVVGQLQGVLEDRRDAGRCAMNGQVWATTAAGNLTTEVYIGMAGGDNQVVWHGMPYLTAPSGSGSEAAWPGFSYGGNTSFSEAWGLRMPQWSDDTYLNEDIARMSLVLRQGQPQYDVGVYYQNLGLAGQGHDNPSTLIPDTSAMSAAGYTYGYVSSSFLTDAAKDYRHGVLFPGKSDYKALILNNQTTLERGDADQILALAKAGLPIVIIGPATAPKIGTPGYNTGGQDAAVQQDMNQLYALIGKSGKSVTSHVVQVATEAGVPAVLNALGIDAAAAHTSNPTSGSILDVRRTSGSTNYYYLYKNSSSTVEQTLTLAGQGVPYALNTWTNDAGVIALTPDNSFSSTKPGNLHVTGTTADAAVFDGNGGLAIQSSTPGTFNTTLSNGNTVSAGISDVPAASTLSQWSLSVDSWTPGPTDTPGDTAHTTIGPITVNADPTTGALPAWTSITQANGYSVNLQDVAGIGTYTTHLSLPSSWTGGRHAYLNLGSVVDTSEVAVNGHQLPPVDFVDLSKIDLGDYLKAGDNTITVTVASPLINAVRVAPNTGASSRARTNNGMVGPVVFTPYGQTTIGGQGK